MTDNWLSSTGAERTYLVLSAINTLSIHAKLLLAGIETTFEPSDIEQARMRLLAFIKRLESLVRDAEDNSDGIVLGADPQMGEIAIKFVAERHQYVAQNTVYQVPLHDLQDLIGSENPEKLPILIEHLRELRSLVERRSHSDVTHVLGDL